MPDILRVEEPFEGPGLDQLAKDMLAVLDRQVGLIPLGFHAVHEPLFLQWVLDVHVFRANLSAIGLAQYFEDFPERGFLQSAETMGEKPPVQIPEGIAEGGRIEFGVVMHRACFQGIQVGHQMAPDPVEVDEHQDLGLLL